MSQPQTLLLKAKIQLEKFPGKGGWTFIRIPELNKQGRRRLGMLKASGQIDTFDLGEVNLMPMGTGRLFLPVNAKMRKAIGKQEGDWVDVTLYVAGEPDPSPITEEEFLLCLQDAPEAYEKYRQQSPEQRSTCFQWVLESKDPNQQAERVAELINRLLQNSGLPKSLK
ncbi:YdeI/OmpD-associated family protein [Arcticibacter sp. MXS-1]|uniref:YdeI/OmpD-associated family protein n=1 Tax=Arcticibacter sp. MXS-1 TaxID=3341726 RepID=UPI0035A8CFCA